MRHLVIFSGADIGQLHGSRGGPVRALSVNSPDRGKAYFVCAQTENSQKSERVALYPICFYGGTD